MTWARLDDGFHSHPRVKRLSYTAVGVFAIGLSYAAHYETDGLLDSEFVKELRQRRGGKAALQELVDAGMFEEQNDGQLGVRNYLSFNPSRAELEQQREKNRGKQRGLRARRRQETLPWSGSSSVERTSVNTPRGTTGREGSSTASTEETPGVTRTRAGWYEWAEAELPDVAAGFLRDCAVDIAERLQSGGYAVTAEAVARELAATYGEAA